MTIAFCPSFDIENYTLTTTYAACCCAKVLEKQCNAKIYIKWVNDLFNGLGKVAGILTETSTLPSKNGKPWVIVGIGINVFEPLLGYPDNIAAHVSSLFKATDSQKLNSNDLRAKIIANVVQSFFAQESSIPQKTYLEYYRKHSLLTNKEVEVEEAAHTFKAKVLGINNDFSLRLLLEDGSERNLIDGEARIPSAKILQHQKLIY